MVAFLFDLQVSNVTEFEALLHHTQSTGTLAPATATPRVLAIAGA
jgi:hypothetical protein